MAGKNRSQIHVKGLGDLWVMEVDPSPALDFTSLGHLQESTIEDKWNPIKVTNERGDKVDVISTEQEFMMATKCLQTAQSIIDIPRLAAAKYHAFRYFGTEDDRTFKYFASDIARIIPGFKMPMKSGLRTLDVTIESLADLERAYDVPLYNIIETQGLIRIQNLMLWTEPRQGLNSSTAKLLDLSGFTRHGSLSADFATIWNSTGSPTPDWFLRFDGSNDVLNFGNILNVDATADFAIEFWLRVKGADGTLQEIMSKKSADANEDGFRFVRTDTDKIEFKLSDGTNSATVITTSTVLADVWKKIGLWVDRNGNARLFINGVADGAAVSVATVTGDCTNTEDLLVGKFAGGFGQVDIGGIRIYKFGAGNLPSNFATLDANHYAAEKSYYGLT